MPAILCDRLTLKSFYVGHRVLLMFNFFTSSDVRQSTVLKLWYKNDYNAGGLSCDWETATKKRSDETQTLRAGQLEKKQFRRSQKFRSAADPLPRRTGRPKFNQLGMVTTFTYKPSLVRIDGRNFELSW